jgi:DNA-binding YbaB/EbfC family protein
MNKKFGGFGGGGMGNMQAMLKQAQKMQADAAKAQEELQEAEVTGVSGGGMVTVCLSGDKNFKSIKIKPEAVDPDDVEMLEDLITAAINEAFNKADELREEKLGPLNGLI